MTKTKEELQAEIAYCYLLNERVRRQTKEHLLGFIYALVLCCLFIVVCVIGSIKFINENSYIPAGVMIGCSIFSLIPIGLCIYFIVSCSKELKKCNKIDALLEEKEFELTKDTVAAA